MRLLIVNPNSSEKVTQKIREAAEIVRFPGEEFTTIPAPYGPELIKTPEENAIALNAVLDAVKQQMHQVDGIVLASFNDTGLEEVRKIAPIPVTGIAISAFMNAVAIGKKFSIVTYSTLVEPSLVDIVKTYGLTDYLEKVFTLKDMEWSDPGSIQDELYDPLLELCKEVAAGGSSDSIIMGGGPLAGLASRFASEVDLPLVDGIASAVGMLRGVCR